MPVLNCIQRCQHTPQRAATDLQWARGPGGTVPVCFLSWSDLSLLACGPLHHMAQILRYAGVPAATEEEEAAAASCWRLAPVPNYMHS